MLNSSCETPDLNECSKQGVNACVVKPADFIEFVKAVRQLGIFCAAISNPRLPAAKQEP